MRRSSWRKTNLFRLIGLFLVVLGAQSAVFVQGASATTAMGLVYVTPAASTIIELPLGGVVSASVDWGDGSPVDAATGPISHTYANAGTYNVSVSGSVGSFGGVGTTGIEDLTQVTSFGDLGITDLSSAFYNATSLVAVPVNLPPNVTTLDSAFYGASSFNGDISHWDVSQVTDMNQLFSGDAAFNQDIGSWDTHNVTSMGYMFQFDAAFNQDISGWDVGNVTRMDNMFQAASSFDANIGGWNTSSVTDMTYMFLSASAFNQDLHSWDVSAVEDMSYMFFASGFDGDISDWQTDAVTTMQGMFAGDSTFNVNISQWHTGAVTNMNDMFDGASAFNQDLHQWDTSHVTDMGTMFKYASSFNNDVSGWDTSQVTNFAGMFMYTAFDGDISTWNTQDATAMTWMFLDDAAFNQAISGWNFANVTDMSQMLDYSGLSITNYDSLLNALAAGPVQTGVTLGAIAVTYSSTSSVARGILMGTDHWTIAGDVLDSASDSTLLSNTVINGVSLAANGSTSVAAGTTSVAVLVQPNNASATYTVNGSTSGTSVTGLVLGPNAVTVVVTAIDLSTTTYTYTVNVALSSDSSLQTDTVINGIPLAANGSTSVAAGTTSVPIVVDPNIVVATYKVNGTASGTSVSGLIAGANTITVVVAAQDLTTTTYTYTVNVASPPANTSPQFQQVLVVISTNGTSGTPMRLVTTGGSGNGAVSYTVTTGSATSCWQAVQNNDTTLNADSAGTCFVIATKQSDGSFESINSTKTEVSFITAPTASVLVAPQSPVVSTPPSAVVPAPWSSLKVVGLTTSSIRAAWSPSRNVLSSAVTGYTCAISRRGHLRKPLWQKTVTHPTCSFNHLRQQTLYGVTIRAIMRTGKSLPATGYTTTLRASVHRRSLSLHWERVPAAAKGSTYEVDASNGKDSKICRNKVGICGVAGLAPNTKYKVTIDMVRNSIPRRIATMWATTKPER